MRYIGDGDWECPKCDRIITFGERDEDDDCYEIDGAPIGCLACGGDYPNCKEACSIFNN